MRLFIPLLSFGLLAPSGLQAQTFADFHAAGASDVLFVYDNNELAAPSTLASLTSTSVSPGTLVKFNYDSDLVFTGAYADLNEEQDAFMVLSSTSGSLVTTAGLQATQTGFSGTLSFIRPTAINGDDHLLDITFDNAVLNILFGQLGAVMSIDIQNAASVEFDSDFLTFVDSGADHFSISLTSITPPTIVQSNQMFRDFVATGNGGFDGSIGALIPEPSTYAAALALAGLFSTAWMRRRRAA